MGDLEGGLGLARLLVLEHQGHQRRGVAARPSPGPGEDRLGQLVHAELVHLGGELDLGLGVEPEAEEPLRRLPRPLDVAREHGQAEGHHLATLHGLLVERVDRLDQLEGLGRLAAPGQDLGQAEPEVDVPPGLARPPG